MESSTEAQTKSPRRTVQLWPKPRPLLLACLAVSAGLSTLLGGSVPRLLGEQASLGVRVALAVPLAAAFIYCQGARREMRLAGGGGPQFHIPVRRLVTSGPFQYTRNPLYVGVVFLICAAAVLLNAVWPLLGLLPCLVYLELVVVPAEEKLLAELFPEEWERYTDAVPRWLVCLHHRFWR